MPGIKCECCELVNSTDAKECRRCGALIAAPGAAFSQTGHRENQRYAPRIEDFPAGGFVENALKKRSRAVQVASVVALVAIAAAVVLNWRYLYNFVLGPEPISAESLKTINSTDNLTRYYVSVQPDRVLSTGIQAVERTIDEDTNIVEKEEVVSDYLAISFDQKLLLLEAPAGKIPQRFTGALVELPPDVKGQVLAKIMTKSPEAQGAFLPVMLDATDFRQPGYIGFAIGGILLILACWGLHQTQTWRANPERHPFMKQLARYGAPSELAGKIDAEVAAGTGVVPMGSVTLTPSFFLISNPWGAKALPLKDVVWAYKRVVKRSVNFVPIGKTYSAVLHDRLGKRIELRRFGGEQRTDHALISLRQTAPWVLVGFSQNLAHAWRSERQQMVAAVDDRRRQVESAAGQT
ncbi:MAG: DUF6709 family protein [Blastocatellia bacterium]